MTVAAPETTTEDVTETLTAHDRCDRCRAQGWVKVELTTGGELIFCSHHYNKHEAGLSLVALNITDERARMNAKPSVSANAD